MEALKERTSIVAVSLAEITSITAASFSSMNFKLDCQKTVQNAAEEIETDIGTFGKNKFWPQSVTGEINQFKLCRNHYKSKLCYLPPVCS